MTPDGIAGLHGLLVPLAAFAAGLLSFLSPCVLPLIPMYLSFISGESASVLRDGAARKFPLLVRTLFFVLGFTTVFVLLAVILGGGMRFVGSSAGPIITRVAGILILLLAANTVFDFIPFLRGEIRAHPAQGSSRPVGPTPSAPQAGSVQGSVKAILLGMAFAAGWSPCIGPILSSILLFAGQNGNIAQASVLLGLYSTGLGVPFVLVGLFFDRATPVLGFFKRHMTAVRIISGLLLFAFGIAMLTGSLSGVSIFFLKAGYALEEYARTGPFFLRPLAGFLSSWFTFQGL
jgi:cytochrome c-type biogenesis protein